MKQEDRKRIAKAVGTFVATYPHGGITHLAKLTNINRDTIREIGKGRTKGYVSTFEAIAQGLDEAMQGWREADFEHTTMVYPIDDSGTPDEILGNIASRLHALASHLEDSGISPETRLKKLAVASKSLFYSLDEIGLSLEETEFGKKQRRK